MAEINISNSAGRDAVVGAESVEAPLRIRWLDPEDRQVRSVRMLKSTVDRDIDALVEKAGNLEDVAAALVSGDPEVDMETVGTLLQETSRVFMDARRTIVHRVQRLEIIRNPTGEERERRPRQLPPPNVSADAPLRWSGKLIKRAEAARKFVFSAKMQLMHVNGLTYDFLYAMAKELHEADSLMLLGAGARSNQPLILRRGGAPYRGFLEGRVDGDRYSLVLHLSNLELRRPEEQRPPEEPGQPEEGGS